MRGKLFLTAMALLIFVSLAQDYALARSRSNYNDDYQIRHEQEQLQSNTDALVQRVLGLNASNPAVSSTQGKVRDINEQRKAITEQIIELKKQELAIGQSIRAYTRQKHNNSVQITELERKLEREAEN